MNNLPNLLREAVLASAAALRARRELLAALGDMTCAQHTMLDATLIALAQSPDPRSVGQAEADALVARLYHSKRG